MAWYEIVATKLWEYLTTPEEGKPKERIALLIVSLLLAGGAYFLITDQLAPNRNVFRRTVATVFGSEYKVYSGKRGGFYIKIGEHLDEKTTRGGIRIKNVEQAASKNLESVLNGSRAFGICQEDTLITAELPPDQINVIAPIYDECLHVLYRKEEFKAVLDGLGVEYPPLLEPQPNQAVQEFFVNSKIRLGSSKPKPGSLPLPYQIVTLCGLNNESEDIDEIEDVVLALQDGDIDIAFVTAGVPVPALKDSEDLTRKSGSLGIMRIHPSLIAELNESLGMPYRLASLRGLYGSQHDHVTTLAVRAFLFASNDVPEPAIQQAADALVNTAGTTVANDIAPILGRYSSLSQVLGTYLGIWPDRIVTWSTSIVAIVVFFLLSKAFLTYVLSSYKLVAYSRLVTAVYNKSLPSHVKLTRAEGHLPVPDLPGDNHSIIHAIIKGISSLIDLAMRIRNDYQSGGLTLRHHEYLVANTYSIKQIFQRHLAQRLNENISNGSTVDKEDIRKLYTGGYILREDYRDLESHCS